MDEEIIIDQEYIEAAKAEMLKNSKLQPCQLAGLCSVMGWSLEDVAKMNLEKLAKRKKSGTIVTHQDH